MEWPWVDLGIVDLEEAGEGEVEEEEGGEVANK